MHVAKHAVILLLGPVVVAEEVATKEVAEVDMEVVAVAAVVAMETEVATTEAMTGGIDHLASC